MSLDWQDFTKRGMRTMRTRNAAESSPACFRGAEHFIEWWAATKELRHAGFAFHIQTGIKMSDEIRIGNLRGSHDIA